MSADDDDEEAEMDVDVIVAKSTDETERKTEESSSCKETIKNDKDSLKANDLMSASSSATSFSSNSLIPGSRMEFVKDIESHIEIIFECLDDEIDDSLVESASGSTLNTTSSMENEVVSVSDSGPSQETSRDLDKSIELKEVDDNDACKKDESKTE